MANMTSEQKPLDCGDQLCPGDRGMLLPMKESRWYVRAVVGGLPRQQCGPRWIWSRTIGTEHHSRGLSGCCRLLLR